MDYETLKNNYDKAVEALKKIDDDAYENLSCVICAESFKNTREALAPFKERCDETPTPA